MLIVTLVSLYTVRVVLQVLGQEDYGIYNVVGGIIGFLSFFTTTLASATQRFLSYELGKGKENKYSSVFSISIISFLVFGLIILLLAEAIFPWLIDYKLNIPSDRLKASVTVFHISVFNFFINLLAIPFSASIIAHERMSFYAYLSILEAVLKLVVIYLLCSIPGDKLIIYSFLYLSITFSVMLMNIIYCLAKFKVCKFSFQWDKIFFKKFTSFIGWNSFGALTSVLSIQGLTLVLNIFFGPIVNAAKAIADKVFATVFSLVGNLILATSPQLTKYSATGEIDKILPLFYAISRLSFFLMYIIAIPLCILMPDLLKMWLGEDCTSLMVILCQITLISMIFSALETPISMTVRSLGKIKKYQIVSGIISILVIPLSIVAYILKAQPYAYSIIQTLLLCISLFYRISILKQILNIPNFNYIKFSLMPIIKVIFYSIVVLIPLYFVPFINYNLLFASIISFFVIIFMIYIFGLNKKEKKFIFSKVANN